MAKTSLSDIDIRPCFVKGEKALFHKWTTRKQVIDASPMIGGHPGGQLESTFGLVEYTNGTIEEVHPSLITFADSRVLKIFEQMQESKQ